MSSLLSSRLLRVNSTHPHSNCQQLTSNRRSMTCRRFQTFHRSRQHHFRPRPCQVQPDLLVAEYEEHPVTRKTIKKRK